jgi:VCBS repeat-containing protein
LGAASFPTAQTFLVSVGAYSSSVFNTGNYTLRVAGSGLDLNDAPVLSVGTVSIRVPDPGVVVDTQVVRNVSAGSTTGVRLDSLFSVTDPDVASSGQSVSYYRFSLTNDEGLNSDAAIVVGSGGTAKTYGFGSGMLLPGNVTLTEAEMATAVFLPGSTAAGSSLKLALQAYDSTSKLNELGGSDQSGSSAILQQTLKIVSGEVGVSLNSSNTKTTLSENVLGEGTAKPNSSSFTLALNQAPTDDVKVYLTDANDQLDLSATVLTFTSANYATAQSVTISATADSKNEGASQAAPLSFQVVSQDSSYDGFLVSPLNFLVVDNVAPLLATPTGLAYTDTDASDLFAAPTSGSVTGTLTGSDANSDSLSYGIFGGTDAGTTVSKTSTFGTLTVTKATGAYVFSPNVSGLNAAASSTSADFTVTVSDGVASSSKVLSVSVAGVNDKPVVSFGSASFTLSERGGAGNAEQGTSDSVIAVALADAEGVASFDAASLLSLGWATSNNGATYTKVGTYGTASLTSGTQALAYVLDDSKSATQALRADESKTDTFALQVTDAQGLTQSGTASFSVVGANDWPVFNPVADRKVELGNALSFDLKSDLSDVDTAVLALTVTLADGSALPAWLSFNSATWTFSGTPTASDLATLSILVTASDELGGLVYDSFELTVAPATQAAVLLADSITGDEDGGVISGNVLSNDQASTDNELSVLTYTVQGETPLDAGQSFTIAGKGELLINTDGSYTFTPLPNVNGTLPVVSYETNDGSSTLGITIDVVDDASVLVADTKTVVEGSTASGNVLLNDSDIDNTLSVASFKVAGNQTVFTAGQTATLANQGALQMLADGSYVFTPLADFTGALPLVTYTANTGSTSTLRINVIDPNAPTGVTVEVQAYAWKSHVFLNDVRVGLDLETGRDTAGQGTTVFNDVLDPLQLSATRAATDDASSAAVSLQDAIAILKLVVGLPVNGSGQALSPYQTLAADYNGNGTVELSDAIDVLKYVVGLPGTQPSWKFLSETKAIAGITADPTQPGSMPGLELPTDNGTSTLRVGLVGFLRGDVDGSYAGAANAEGLSRDYFTALALEQNLNASQFGVY